MYVLAKGRSIVALDAATGRELWAHANEGAVGTRGMNYWRSADGSEERLLYLNAGHLTAIDAKTGETIRSFGADGRVDLRVGLDGDITTIRALQTSNPGRIFEDTIIMSLPAGGGGYASAPADIHAYNVRTGALQWIFHTVPRPGEFGADTWPEAGLGNYGGVHNWSESTVDAELGIVYIPTGTARYDFYGGNRHGENLFGNSLLALDARTGKRLWHFQTIHHDLWDYDLPTAPKLLTVVHDGMSIPADRATEQAGLRLRLQSRHGRTALADRGAPRAAIRHAGRDELADAAVPDGAAAVRAAALHRGRHQPAHLGRGPGEGPRDSCARARNEGLYTPPSLQGTIMMPGHNGGANWGGSAVDPHERPALHRLEGAADDGEPARSATAGARRRPRRRRRTARRWTAGGNRPPPLPPPNAGPDFIPYTAPADFMIQPSTGLSAIGPPWSQITAYDLNKGTIMWQIPNGDVASLAANGIVGTGSHAPRGGVVATGGGLLFIGTSSDRKFRAYDADTGRVLWSYDLPAATEGVPAVYSVGGRQYVAIAVGGNGLFSQGLDQPEPGPGQYMVFALGSSNQ